jgi:hypothetical protein
VDNSAENISESEINSDFGPVYELGDKSNPKLGKLGFDKTKTISYLESCCPKLVQAAQERGDWEHLCAKPFPALAAEQLAVFLALKDTNAVEIHGDMETAIVKNLKRVKRHLIHRNMTVLEANENNMLREMIEFCHKQDAVKPIGVHSTDHHIRDIEDAEAKVG